jgi:hypothetical protein
MEETPPATARRLPPRAWVGLALTATFWPLNWILPDRLPRTAYLFFPLWLGYILIVDALVWWRTGTSAWARSRLHFLVSFLISIPAWWLFEIINAQTKNWTYQGRDLFGPLEYFILASVSFSTVIPAVFGTAELVRSFPWVDRLSGGARLRPSRGLCVGLFLAGVGMLAVLMKWPQYGYPLVWGSVFLILEPLNVGLGRPNFFQWLEKGDWRPVISLSAGALVCGFFWELWNYYSFPKWEYTTPGAQFWHVFEMPLLGYLGYLPFAWELHALRHFLWPGAPALRL